MQYVGLVSTMYCCHKEVEQTHISLKNGIHYRNCILLLCRSQKQVMGDKYQFLYFICMGRVGMLNNAAMLVVDLYNTKSKYNVSHMKRCL